jgi:DNA (cytosine-5)-methyltransferase 1
MLSPLDRECISLIKQGENWRALPETMRNQRFSKIRAYDATTMMKRPFWDSPSYTITTKSNDATAGAFIHPQQNRTLTLREAARLQSFPDNYKFVGSDSQIRELIGNAVPPLLAEQLALAIAPEVCEASEKVLPTTRKIRRVTFEPSTELETLLGLKCVQEADPNQLELVL